MPIRPTAQTITPEQGGRLMAVRSIEGVGTANYAAKINLRRKDIDREGRREGWVLLRPNSLLAQGVQAVPSASAVLLLAQLVRPNQDKALIAATATEIFKYNYATGVWDSMLSGIAAGGRWQPVVLNGYLVLNNAVNLPITVRVEEGAAYPIYELREAGIASVGFIEELNGILMCYDVTEIQAANLNAVMTGGSPYGTVAANLCNRIVFRAIWGEIGKPRSWAPRFTVTQAASSATITLPFASTAFVAGVTRVAVKNGGPSGGTLGGQTAYPNGILVTAVAGAVLTLEIPTDAGLTYPRQIEVLRWEDQSTISGYYDLQDDGSEITAVRKLAHRVIIYRKTGIFRATYVGDVDQVFEFRRIVGTENVPIWRDAVVSVNGEYHLYPGEGNEFYAFDGTNEPIPHKLCNDARTVFFTGINPASDVFAVDNPLTKEIWFCRPNKVMAFDYKYDTVSEIDAEIGAACYIERPSSKDRWFIMAIGTTIFTYGLVKSALLEVLTFLRNGVAVNASFKSGLVHWGDRYNEKDIVCYLAHLASGTDAPALRLKLYSTHDERVAPVAVLTEDMVGPDYKVDMLYRAIFFQDELIITDTRDIDVQITGRTFDRAPVRSQSTPRNGA